MMYDIVSPPPWLMQPSFLPNEADKKYIKDTLFTKFTLLHWQQSREIFRSLNTVNHLYNLLSETDLSPILVISDFKTLIYYSYSESTIHYETNAYWHRAYDACFVA